MSKFGMPASSKHPSCAIHKAIDKMFETVESKGYTPDKVQNISVAIRTNNATGLHVHAACSIKLRFDASVTPDEATTPYVA